MVMIVSGCGSQQSAVSKPAQKPADMKNILVVSFRDMSQTVSDQTSIRCPLSGKVFTAGAVSKEAETVLTDHLKKLWAHRGDLKFITPQKLMDIRGEISSQDLASEIRLLTEAGRKLEADGVIACHIYRYQERVGGKYSVESPASVAFDMHLVRTADGRVLWSRHFDETQKSLSEDLFQLDAFLKRDGQWVTAEQMAQAGLEQIVEGFDKP